VAPGGTIANVECTGSRSTFTSSGCGPATSRFTTRLVDTATTPMLLKTVQARKIDPKRLITHRFTLDHILDAYQALKVIIKT
jgi:alcohol dehydrogenase